MKRKLFQDGSLGELILAAAVASAVIVLASVERAESAPAQRCMPSANVEHMLSTKYNEAPIGAGLTPGGNLLQLWVAQDGSSWTLVGMSPQGISCIVDAGREWITASPQPVGDPS